jgi:hypothetical protein
MEMTVEQAGRSPFPYTRRDLFGWMTAKPVTDTAEP